MLRLCFRLPQTLIISIRIVAGGGLAIMEARPMPLLCTAAITRRRIRVSMDRTRHRLTVAVGIRHLHVQAAVVRVTLVAVVAARTPAASLPAVTRVVQAVLQVPVQAPRRLVH